MGHCCTSRDAVTDSREAEERRSRGPAVAEPAEQFAREGASAVEMSSAEFGKYIVTEITKWGEVVEKSKIRPQ